MRPVAILALIVGAVFVAILGQEIVSYIVAGALLVVAWLLGNST